MKKTKLIIGMILMCSCFVCACSNTSNTKDNNKGNINQESSVSNSNKSTNNKQETNESNSSNDEENSETLTKIAFDYIDEIQYKNSTNSAAGLEILLPTDFNEVINDYDIGAFLKKRNELSKENGFDFEEYLGTEVYLFTCSSEVDDLILLINDNKIIGSWIDNNKEESDFHIIRTNTNEL